MKNTLLKFSRILLLEIVVTILICGSFCYGQRPITDSIITKMYAEIFSGNCDFAIALADSGYKYSLIEEPHMKDKWRAFFEVRKAQINVIYKNDIEAGEKSIEGFNMEVESLDESALYWYLQFINLKGDLYYRLGDNEKAKDMYLAAYNANSENYRSETMFYDRMTELYLDSDQLDSANNCSQSLISVLKSNGDTLTNTYYSGLMKQAYVNAKLENYEKSDSIVEYVKEHYGSFKKKNNYAIRHMVFYKMARIKALSGDFLSAEKLMKESQQLFIKYRGKKDYKYCNIIGQIGNYHCRLNQMDSVYHYVKDIPELLMSQTLNKTDMLSIRGKEIFMKQFEGVMNSSMFMLNYFDNGYTDYNEKLYDYMLFQKRITSQSLEKLKFHFLNVSNEHGQNKFVLWQKKRLDYFDWLTTHKASDDSSKILANELEIEEKGLFRQAGLTYSDNQKPVYWKDILKNLTNKSVATEFLRYMNIETKEYEYGTLVVSPNHDHPIFVKICTEVDLKKSITYNFAETDFEFVQRVYNSGKLYNLIWKPLEPYLKGTENCYVSLSGLFYKIALDATFPKNANIRPKIHLVHSTAAIVDNVAVLPSNPSISLYGGIKYNLKKVEQIDSLSATISENVHAIHRGGQADKWNYLKGTENEVKEISRILKKSGYEVQLNLGTKCSEGTFKNELNGKSPHILHIATHGYYPVSADSVLSYTHSASYARSGLVMAGANTSKTSNAPIEGYGDGILTAPEITALNLSNTQLVVLSACETGKGQVSHVDEIYGLQRAFKITGAQYVIYTLWKIPDESTKEFMVYFYKTLSDGKSIERSFFMTKEYMKKNYPVYHWAGFQLIK